MSEDTQGKDQTVLTELEHPYKRAGEKPSFENFLPFVKINDPRTKERFVTLLKEIFSETGDLWYPGGCYRTEHIKALVRDLKRSGKLHDAIITPMNWADAHYYLSLRFEGSNTDLIIDPFGVPTPGKDYYLHPETIIPFFGEMELAPPHHKGIYKDAKPVGEKGFHRFIP